MTLTKAFLRFFIYVFIFQLVLSLFVALTLYFVNRDRISDDDMKSLTSIEPKIYESIILQQKINNFIARDLIAYKLIELNRLSDVEIVNVKVAKNEIMNMNNCKRFQNIVICNVKNKNKLVSYLPLQFNNSEIATLKLSKIKQANGLEPKTYLLVLSTLFLSFLFNVLIMIFLWKKFLKKDFDKLIKSVRTQEYNSEIKILEYNEIQKKVFSVYRDLQEREKDRLMVESANFEIRVSRQIAHDIRSPLEALRSVTGHIDELDFQHRKIITSSIQRISDIANGLLREGRGVDKVGLVNLNILVEEVYQDKIFEQGKNIKLVNNITYNDSFVYGDENALYRVLSNIINNSFEAYKSNKGEVIIEVDVSNSFVEIKVQDFGEGMSSEFVQKIIEGGVTTKDKGNGLGVSSAKNEISKHNGKFTIDSKIGVGTIIKIELPRVVCPSWFSSIIEVDLSLEKIICVDDDPAFLEFYQEKLKEFKDKTVCISAKKFEDHTISKNNQYFFDYDLGGDKAGLDLILDNNISQQSTLVTSMYQDEKIQDVCTKNGIKILPKQIFNTAKVKIKNEVKSIIIFIDNDDLMHLAWKMEASKKGISIETYFSVDDFLDDADKFSNEIKIYIDSDLGDGIRGEVESKKIFDHGFTNLYLATGYLAEDISKPDWIIDIVGKRPTFLT